MFGDTPIPLNGYGTVVGEFGTRDIGGQGKVWHTKALRGSSVCLENGMNGMDLVPL